MEKFILNNKIEALIKENKSTPRSAVILYAKLNKDEEKCGTNCLMTQLLLQGTEKRTSEQLATELDENAIDIDIEKKADYIRLKLLCLNEDIETGLEILSDILFNSTFSDYEKEKVKIKGELEADLDSPKITAQDEYYRTIFKNHPYGTGRKEILNSIDSITKEDILSAYNDLKYVLEKNISFAGDIEPNIIKELFEKYFGGLKEEKNESTRKKVEPLTKNLVSVIEKEDANQAQIFKGWNIEGIHSEDYPAIMLINTILSSLGLSSRLFLELREKRGLAYTVRGIFETYESGGHYFVYIATEPKNINVSIEGFDVEMNKIMNEYVSDEEIENAKNSAIGKRQFYKETNISEANFNGYYECLKLGYDFEEKLIERVKNLTKEDILKTAAKYFSKPSALCVLAPKKYLEDANLL